MTAMDSSRAMPKSLKRARLRRNFQKFAPYYFMLLPAIVYVAIFNYAPLYGLQIAFKDFKGSLGFAASRWVGLKHFISFFESHYFWELLRNTFALSLYSLAVGFPIPIILALMLNELGPKYKRFTQTVLYAPHFISTVVMVGIIMLMLSPSYGVVNTVIKALGHDPIYFMSLPSAFRHIYVWSGVWQGMGWSAVIYLAALSAVSPELHLCIQARHSGYQLQFFQRRGVVQQRGERIAAADCERNLTQSERHQPVLMGGRKRCIPKTAFGNPAAIRFSKLLTPPSSRFCC